MQSDTQGLRPHLCIGKICWKPKTRFEDKFILGGRIRSSDRYIVSLYCLFIQVCLWQMIACWSVTQVAWVQSLVEVLIFLFFHLLHCYKSINRLFPYAVSMIPTSAVGELLSYCQAYNYNSFGTTNWDPNFAPFSALLKTYTTKVADQTTPGLGLAATALCTDATLIRSRD